MSRKRTTYSTELKTKLVLELLKEADLALYEAKGDERDKSVFRC